MAKMLPVCRCPHTGCTAITSLPTLKSESLPFYNNYNILAWEAADFKPPHQKALRVRNWETQDRRLWGLEVLAATFDAQNMSSFRDLIPFHWEVSAVATPWRSYDREQSRTAMWNSTDSSHSNSLKLRLKTLSFLSSQTWSGTLAYLHPTPAQLLIE